MDKVLLAALMGHPKTRWRTKNKKGARHAVNPAGSKFLKDARRRTQGGRRRVAL